MHRHTNKKNKYQGKIEKDYIILEFDIYAKQSGVIFSDKLKLVVWATITIVDLLTCP